MIYERMEFIPTNCLMRKGYKIDIDVENLSDEAEIFVWNFRVEKEDVPEYVASLVSSLDSTNRHIFRERMAGKKFREIGKNLPISFQAVFKRYKKALKRMNQCKR